MRFLTICLQQCKDLLWTPQYMGSNLSRIAVIKFMRTEPKMYDNNNELNQVKTKLLLQMNFKDGTEAAPFLKLPISTLLKIYKTVRADAASGFCTNRLYYLAQRIQYPVLELSKQIPERLFLYTLPAQWIKEALDILIEMKVPGERIARDLWVLTYHPDTIRTRLQTVQNAGITDMHPWMVRCPVHTLNRYIELRKESKNILGDKSIHTYLAERLNTTQEVIEDAFIKVPALKNVRITKLKRFIDYLLKEGFTKEDIATKLRVVTASQTTVKRRIQILRKLGVQSINLNLLLRSQDNFEKYCKCINLDKQNTSL